MNPTWQPIETAPKDGTRIMVYGRGVDGAVWDTKVPMPLLHGIAYWHYFETDRYIDAGDGLYKKVRTQDLAGWRIGYSWFTPTHWMPLPEPPSAEDVARTLDAILQSQLWGTGS